MATDDFGLDSLDFDELDQLFQDEFGLSEDTEEFSDLDLQTLDELLSEEDPNNRKKRDEFDLDLDDLEDLESLISPDSSLEDIFNVFDQYTSDRPYLGNDDSLGDSGDSYDDD